MWGDKHLTRVLDRLDHIEDEAFDFMEFNSGKRRSITAIMDEWKALSTLHVIIQNGISKTKQKRSESSGQQPHKL